MKNNVYSHIHFDGQLKLDIDEMMCGWKLQELFVYVLENRFGSRPSLKTFLPFFILTRPIPMTFQLGNSIPKRFLIVFPDSIYFGIHIPNSTIVRNFRYFPLFRISLFYREFNNIFLPLFTICFDFRVFLSDTSHFFSVFPKYWKRCFPVMVNKYVLS